MTTNQTTIKTIKNDFYSHAPCEAWLAFYGHLLICLHFYSHAPCEAWHEPPKGHFYEHLISTHTPLARRDVLHLYVQMRILISTHTPLARRDGVQTILFNHFKDFYSHAPCEAWLRPYAFHRFGTYFYSHAPCEAWHLFIFFKTILWNFYSHAPCEAWPFIDWLLSIALNFYSHAPCEAWQWLYK